MNSLPTVDHVSGRVVAISPKWLHRPADAPLGNTSGDSGCRRWSSVPFSDNPRKRPYRKVDCIGSDALGLPNDEALAGSFRHSLGHLLQGVDFGNSFDLGEQPIQQPEVAAGDPDNRPDRFRV